MCYICKALSCLLHKEPDKAYRVGKMGMKEGLIVLPTLPLGKSVISPCRGNKHSYNEQKEYYATAKRIHYFYSPFKL